MFRRRAGLVEGRNDPDGTDHRRPLGGGEARASQAASPALSARRHSCRPRVFRIHDLRHTAASLMIQAGYPPKMLQEIMGHAASPRPSTCTGTYTPERWTATLTGSMRRPPKVMRPKCGQTRTPTKPSQRSQGAELGNGGALGGTRTPNLLIRRSGQVVQDRPLRSVRWADIPQLSTRDRRCPAAWLQSRRNGLDARPPVFQGGRPPRSAVPRCGRVPKRSRERRCSSDSLRGGQGHRGPPSFRPKAGHQGRT